MDLTFAGYRFTDRKYYTLSQYLDLRDDRVVDSEKERYQITLSKRLGEFNINLNYQLQQYWDRGQTHQYGLNIGKSINLPYLKLQEEALHYQQIEAIIKINMMTKLA